METIDGMMVLANNFTHNNKPAVFSLLLKLSVQRYPHVYKIIEYFAKSGQYFYYHPESVN